MFKDKIPEQYRRAYWVSTRAILLILVVGGNYILLEVFTNIGIRSRLTATGIVASTLLTFALIAVYRSIRQVQISQTNEIAAQRKLQEDVLDIEEEQTNIMRTQTQMIAQSHSPDIYIKEVESTNNSVICDLENRGSGLAIDVVLIAKVTTPISNPQANSPYSLGEAVCPAERTDSNKHKSVGVIRENNEQTFEFPIRLPTGSSDDGEQNIMHYGQAMKQLSESYDSITVSFSIRYSDSSGNNLETDYKTQTIQTAPEIGMDDIL